MVGAILLLAGGALWGQQLHPVQPPQPSLPAPTPGAAAPLPVPPPSKQAPAAQTKKPGASAAANALPGQQLTPSGKPWTGDKYSPARAKHDMQVAHFYYVRQNYRAALSRIQGALRHDPHWPPALYAAGLVEAKIGQYAAARRYWADYLRRMPRGKKAKTIRKQLRKFPPPAAKS